MALKVGINGFGRIGRNIFRASWPRRQDIQIVAVNDLGEASVFAHLLKYDTALGTFAPPVTAGGADFSVDGRKTLFLSEKDPSRLPWRDLGVDVVIEATGLFTDAKRARAHIDGGGAKKVIISAPATHQDYTVVMGVNHAGYRPADHHVISNGSCTTNCLVPVVQGAARPLRGGARHDDHRPRLHRRPEAPGPAPQRPAPGPRRRRQHHTHLHRRQPGGGRGAARAGRPLCRHGLPGAGAGRLGGGSQRHPGQEDQHRRHPRRPASRPPTGRSRASCRSATRRWCRATSSPTRTPPSSMRSAHLCWATRTGPKMVSWYDNEWGFSCRMVDLLSLVARSL